MDIKGIKIKLQVSETVLLGQRGVGYDKGGGSPGEGAKTLLPPLEPGLRSKPSKRNGYPDEQAKPAETAEAAAIKSLYRTRENRSGAGCRAGSYSATAMNPAMDDRSVDLISYNELLTADNILWVVGECTARALRADGVNVYVFDNKTAYILKSQSKEENNKIERVLTNFVGLEDIYKTCVINEKPLRLRHKVLQHTLNVPLEINVNNVNVVLELFRGQSKFKKEDEQEALKKTSFESTMTRLWKQNNELKTKELLHTYVLKVAESIFKEMDSLNNLMEKIVHYAQDLVQADRASVFLTDPQKRELYATVFDVGFKGEKEFKEIRFPIGTGIAGYVAETGITLNILDAYEDSRFNRNIDQITGYRTKSLLCMPIYSNNAIIGVVQMVNKKEGSFTPSDVEAFKMFAVYCGLALHNVKLYTKIQRSEQKYKVAIEVLSYHNTCSSDEVNEANNDVDNLVNNYLYTNHINFDYNTFILQDYGKALSAIEMFQDLFKSTDIDRMYLIRFVLTVKKNYRKIPYHNWAHGYSVANTMYNILKRQGKVFTRNEQLALFVGCLCHDLDHRGKNNKFMLESESPLAHMYSTSTLEHHHFNQTVVILQQEGHNIFSKLSYGDFKNVLKLLKHCILSTDLVVFFPNRDALRGLLDQNLFSWDETSHRNLALAVSMTASDLSASAKPWQVQTTTVKVIFKEFYEQGDAERDAKKVPIAMMDRNRPEEQPDSQVGFLAGVCLPCYQILNELLPATEPLYTMCQENLKKWLEIAEQIKKVKENKSITEIQSFLNKLIYEDAQNGDKSYPCDSNGNANNLKSKISRIFTDLEVFPELTASEILKQSEVSPIDITNEDVNQVHFINERDSSELLNSEEEVDLIPGNLPMIEELDEDAEDNVYDLHLDRNIRIKFTDNDKDDDDVVTATVALSLYSSY